MSVDPGTLARLKAVANPQRLALLELMQRPDLFPHNLVDARNVGVCVNDLAHAAGLAQSTASYHLSLLREAGLVVETPHGQWRYVRPDRDAFEELGRLVAAFATPGE